MYDARVVMLRRAVLRALAALCGQADLVCAEVARGGKATGAAAPGKGGFLAGGKVWGPWGVGASAPRRGAQPEQIVDG